MIAGAAPTHKWRQANSHRLLVFNRSYSHSLLQPHATIAAARSIDLNHAFETVVGNLGASHTDHSAGNLQHIARSSTHTLQIGWSEPRNRVTHVFDARLRNSQRESCSGR